MGYSFTLDARAFYNADIVTNNQPAGGAGFKTEPNNSKRPALLAFTIV
jgi:hypothetical protein